MTQQQDYARRLLEKLGGPLSVEERETGRVRGGEANPVETLLGLIRWDESVRWRARDVLLQEAQNLSSLSVHADTVLVLLLALKSFIQDDAELDSATEQATAFTAVFSASNQNPHTERNAEGKGEGQGDNGIPLISTPPMTYMDRHEGEVEEREEEGRPRRSPPPSRERELPQPQARSANERESIQRPLASPPRSHSLSPVRLSRTPLSDRRYERTPDRLPLPSGSPTPPRNNGSRLQGILSGGLGERRAVSPLPPPHSFEDEERYQRDTPDEQSRSLHASPLRRRLLSLSVSHSGLSPQEVQRSPQTAFVGRGRGAGNPLRERPTIRPHSNREQRDSKTPPAQTRPGFPPRPRGGDDRWRAAFRSAISLPPVRESREFAGVEEGGGEEREGGRSPVALRARLQERLGAAAALEALGGVGRSHGVFRPHSRDRRPLSAQSLPPAGIFDFLRGRLSPERGSGQKRGAAVGESFGGTAARLESAGVGLGGVDEGRGEKGATRLFQKVFKTWAVAVGKQKERRAAVKEFVERVEKLLRVRVRRALSRWRDFSSRMFSFLKLLSRLCGVSKEERERLQRGSGRLPSVGDALRIVRSEWESLERRAFSTLPSPLKTLEEAKAPQSGSRGVIGDGVSREKDKKGAINTGQEEERACPHLPSSSPLSLARSLRCSSDLTDFSLPPSLHFLFEYYKRVKGKEAADPSTFLRALLKSFRAVALLSKRLASASASGAGPVSVPGGEDGGVFRVEAVFRHWRESAAQRSVNERDEKAQARVEIQRPDRGAVSSSEEGSRGMGDGKARDAGRPLGRLFKKLSAWQRDTRLVRFNAKRSERLARRVWQAWKLRVQLGVWVKLRVKEGMRERLRVCFRIWELRARQALAERHKSETQIAGQTLSRIRAQSRRAGLQLLCERIERTGLGWVCVGRGVMLQLRSVCVWRQKSGSMMWSALGRTMDSFKRRALSDGLNRILRSLHAQQSERERNERCRRLVGLRSRRMVGSLERLRGTICGSVLTSLSIRCLQARMHKRAEMKKKKWVWRVLWRGYRMAGALRRSVTPQLRAQKEDVLTTFRRFSEVVSLVQEALTCRRQASEATRALTVQTRQADVERTSAADTKVRLETQSRKCGMRVIGCVLRRLAVRVGVQRWHRVCIGQGLWRETATRKFVRAVGRGVEGSEGFVFRMLQWNSEEVAEREKHHQGVMERMCRMLRKVQMRLGVQELQRRSALKALVEAEIRAAADREREGAARRELAWLLEQERDAVKELKVAIESSEQRMRQAEETASSLREQREDLAGRLHERVEGVERVREAAAEREAALSAQLGAMQGRIREVETEAGETRASLRDALEAIQAEKEANGSLEGALELSQARTVSFFARLRDRRRDRETEGLLRLSFGAIRAEGLCGTRLSGMADRARRQTARNLTAALRSVAALKRARAQCVSKGVWILSSLERAKRTLMAREPFLIFQDLLKLSVLWGGVGEVVCRRGRRWGQVSGIISLKEHVESCRQREKQEDAAVRLCKRLRVFGERGGWEGWNKSVEAEERRRIVAMAVGRIPRLVSRRVIRFALQSLRSAALRRGERGVESRLQQETAVLFGSARLQLLRAVVLTLSAVRRARLAEGLQAFRSRKAHCACLEMMGDAFSARRVALEARCMKLSGFRFWRLVFLQRRAVKSVSSLVSKICSRQAFSRLRVCIDSESRKRLRCRSGCLSLSVQIASLVRDRVARAFSTLALELCVRTPLQDSHLRHGYQTFAVRAERRLLLRAFRGLQSMRGRDRRRAQAVERAVSGCMLRVKAQVFRLLTVRPLRTASLALAGQALSAHALAERRRVAMEAVAEVHAQSQRSVGIWSVLRKWHAGAKRRREVRAALRRVLLTEDRKRHQLQMQAFKSWLVFVRVRVGVIMLTDERRQRRLRGLRLLACALASWACRRFGTDGLNALRSNVVRGRLFEDSAAISAGADHTSLLEMRLADLKERLAASESAVVSAEGKIQAQRESSRVLSTAEADLRGRFEAALREAEEARERAAQAEGETRRAEDRIALVESELTCLRSSVSALQSDQEGTVRLLQERQEETAALKRRLTSANEEQSRLVQSLAETAKEAATAKDEVEAAQIQRVQTTEALRTADAEISQLRLALEEREAAVGAEKARTVKEREGKRRIQERWKAEVAQLHAALELNRSRVSLTEEQMHDLRSQLQRQNEEMNKRALALTPVPGSPTGPLLLPASSLSFSAAVPPPAWSVSASAERERERDTVGMSLGGLQGSLQGGMGGAAPAPAHTALSLSRTVSPPGPGRGHLQNGTQKHGPTFDSHLDSHALQQAGIISMQHPTVIPPMHICSGVTSPLAGHNGTPIPSLSSFAVPPQEWNPLSSPQPHHFASRVADSGSWTFGQGTKALQGGRESTAVSSRQSHHLFLQQGGGRMRQRSGGRVSAVHKKARVGLQGGSERSSAPRSFRTSLRGGGAVAGTLSPSPQAPGRSLVASSLSPGPSLSPAGALPVSSSGPGQGAHRPFGIFPPGASASASASVGGPSSLMSRPITQSGGVQGTAEWVTEEEDEEGRDVG